MSNVTNETVCDYCNGFDAESKNCLHCLQEQLTFNVITRASKNRKDLHDLLMRSLKPTPANLLNHNLLNIIKQRICVHLSEGMPINFWNNAFRVSHIMTNFDFNQYCLPLAILVQSSKITMTAAKFILLMLFPTLEKKNFDPNYKAQGERRESITITRKTLMVSFEKLVYSKKLSSNAKIGL